MGSTSPSSPQPSAQAATTNHQAATGSMAFKPYPQPKDCPGDPNAFVLALSLCLCTGLVISYLPQHIRIISAGSSEGFSPWYLLLGATSSASGMLNLLILQWPIFQCCKLITTGRCLASLLGFVQVGLQWFLFTIILVLYLAYFPYHLKFQRVLPVPADSQYGSTENATSQEAESGLTVRVYGTSLPVKAKLSTTPEWRLAVTLAWVVALHLGLLLLLSLSLLIILPSTKPQHRFLRYLATFLGLSGTILAILQYAPQIYKTYRAKLVGALSLGTMAIQVPGSVAFVISLLLRPGTDWTSWLPYAVTGLMQGALLIICLMWKRRQTKLGVDDFGNPLPGLETPDESQPLVQ